MAEHLLGTIVELLSVIRREQLAAAGVKSHSLPAPITLDRPGVERREPPVVSATDAARMLGITPTSRRR